eukprot:scaffold2308_cov215-Skeletonema_menzelii.AAC.4
MASSSAAAAASQQSQSRHLTRQANSHGPYLWSGADIENALLWFPRPTKQHATHITTSQQRGNERDEENDTIDEETTADSLTENKRSSSAAAAAEQSEETGCEFLRLLLHSRGIWNPRPSKKKRHHHLASGDDTVNKRKRKRKRNGSPTTDDGSKQRPSSSMELSSPLQSVLLGYYQLFHQKVDGVTPLDTSLEDGNNNNNNNDKKDDKNEEMVIDTAASAAATLQASSKLFNDLSTIISSRQHTHEIYHASLQKTATNLSSSSTRRQEYPLSSPIQHDQNDKLANMTLKIDQYMVHPTTCARRVYASSIYDRLLHLAGTSTTNTSKNNNINEEDAPTTSKEVQKFLQKLFGLATTMDNNNGKIQEVILLLVLEPLRRVQVRQRQLIMKEKKREDKVEAQDCLDAPSSAPHHPERGEDYLMELFPLLASQIVSLSTLSTKNNLSDEDAITNNDESSSSSHLITLLVKSILHTNSETWWSQPSPLLCTISHYHLPFARKYLHYWVKKALVTHESCYKHEKGVEEFHHAVERLQEFHQTSYRLCNLLSHVISNMEEEVRMSSCKLMMDEEEEEDESEVFKTSLALRAVKRALGK